ncbi:sugar ABC transporter substrate-binding protein [Cellulomonas dongxiuzhuiae]|uniref:Extracellular solute-binding protein n=1 Tax=Cellulomonas dongxiuzhuiae TaxID=2819979 RepID=A0ABX8GH87_9CELL|nr:extracellular solute-binding protein [Cellulomonas dongxiuzhuiae]MBO3086868.1 extracellular solute-binding protein [Cellulomonas dongxiuzhuiae]MBO3093780.1 extracellular solute-binding protein [Cellulomonas dongxiuzhuiae]QWC14886.1 extracellular solute-binding protein [Cellulomonas dongxiuzhuiae]
MRRGIPAAAVTLGLALALTACGGNSDDTSGDATSEPASGASGDSLVVWVDETRQAAVEVAAQAFEDENDVDVELVLKNFEDIRTDFLAQVPTGEGPDLTVGAHDWLGELTSNGVVAPIELGDKAGDFIDVAVEAFSQDGQVYGLPYAIENVALIRNTALAAEAPATWDQAVAAGQAAGTQYQVLIQTTPEGDPYTYYPLQTSFGAPVFAQNEDGTYTSELTMGGAPGQAFATWLQAQGAAGVLSTDVTYDIAVEAFKNGEAPFIIGGPWMVDQFEALELSIDPIPSAGGEPALPFVGVQGFYVSAQSDNALLANDFLVNYIATDEAQLALYEAGNRPPALASAAEEASSDPITAGFLAVGEEALPMPSIPEMGSVWAFWGVTEANIISGAAEPVAAWDKMIADIQGAIGS